MYKSLWSSKIEGHQEFLAIFLTTKSIFVVIFELRIWSSHDFLLLFDTRQAKSKSSFLFKDSAKDEEDIRTFDIPRDTLKTLYLSRVKIVVKRPLKRSIVSRKLINFTECKVEISVRSIFRANKKLVKTH